MNISVTRRFTFEAAHAISNYDGPCRNIHGHSYKLYITISGPVNENSDMVMDFTLLKKIVAENVIKKYDHAFITKKGENVWEIPDTYKIVFLDFQPTVERMLEDIYNLIFHEIPEGLILEKIVLCETENCQASWSRV